MHALAALQPIFFDFISQYLWFCTPQSMDSAYRSCYLFMATNAFLLHDMLGRCEPRKAQQAAWRHAGKIDGGDREPHAWRHAGEGVGSDGDGVARGDAAEVPRAHVWVLSSHQWRLRAAQLLRSPGQHTTVSGFSRPPGGCSSHCGLESASNHGAPSGWEH